MTQHVNHKEDRPELNRELQELVSGSGIAWSKTKEEVWAEMQAKLDGKESPVITSRTISLKVVRYAAAAVLVLFVGFAAAMNLYTKKIETTSGQEKEITLPDNSTVKLYGQSTLSYKPLKWIFSRSVKLEGEGLFEVEKGKNFEVVSPKAKTVVLGTRFIVYSRGEAYQVSCQSGKVEVIETAHKNKVRIGAGLKAVLKSDGKFKIFQIAKNQPENQKKTRERMIDEQLKHILTNPPEKIKTQNDEAAGLQEDKREQIKAPEEEMEPGEAPESDKAKGQVQTFTGAGENIQVGKQTNEPTQRQATNRNREQNMEQGDKQRPKGQAEKDRFRASLTKEQISILEDEKMDREQKRKAFLESLSPEQLNLLQEQNAGRANQAQENSNGEQQGQDLKEQQKMQMREQSRKSSGNQNNEMYRQQFQENREDMKPDERNAPGAGNGPGR